jgi:hypothetical protein
MQVGQQHVQFTLDLVQTRRQTVRIDGKKMNREEKKLRLELQGFDRLKSRVSWEDDDVKKLEQRIKEMAVELIVAGECQYRESAQRHYDWRVQRKVQLEKEAQLRKAEQERLERERQIKIERERTEWLLGEATALRQANEIRAYVEAVRSGTVVTQDSIPSDQINIWATWALTQADRIDPIKTGAFYKAWSEKSKSDCHPAP